MNYHSDPFAHVQNSAHEWLAAVANGLGTTDRRYAYRVLRAWLHALRDRLTVDAAAHFGAQLPELLRGVYYDGWVPSRVPVRYGVEDCLDRISAEATVRRADVRDAISGVSAGMGELLSDGALEHALEQLPKDLRELFTADRVTRSPAPADGGVHAQLRGLRDDVALLADAVATLARGLEQHSADEPLGRHGTEAAQTVSRIMLTRQA